LERDAATNKAAFSVVKEEMAHQVSAVAKEAAAPSAFDGAKDGMQVSTEPDGVTHVRLCVTRRFPPRLQEISDME
jgi:hypothetical protein